MSEFRAFSPGTHEMGDTHSAGKQQLLSPSTTAGSPGSASSALMASGGSMNSGSGDFWSSQANEMHVVEIPASDDASETPPVSPYAHTVLAWQAQEAQRYFQMDFQPRYQEQLMSAAMRLETCNWMFTAARSIGLPANAPFLAMNIMDRWVARTAMLNGSLKPLNRNGTRRFAATSFGLALKLSVADDRRQYSAFTVMQHLTGESLSQAELKSLEMIAVQVLYHEIETPTVFDFFSAASARACQLYARRNPSVKREVGQGNAEYSSTKPPFAERGVELLIVCLREMELMARYPAPVLAGACLLLAVNSAEGGAAAWQDYLELILEDLGVPLTHCAPQDAIQLGGGVERGRLPVNVVELQTQSMVEMMTNAQADITMAVDEDQ